MTRKIRNLGIIGGLIIAGGVFISGSNFENYSEKEEYSEKLNSFLGKQSELYIASDLEKKLKEEKEKFSKPLYLTPDLLNVYIKQAYNNVKKWPKEFDKRLYRLLIGQESRYDAHAISWAGAMGLTQIMPDTYETLRPEEWNSFKDSITGKIDTLALQRKLLDPITNIEISLEYLNYVSNFCKENRSKWDTLNLEGKRKTVLACYNGGHGRIQNVKWDLKSEELKEETRNYPEVIMKAYYDPKVKVKL